MKFTALLLLSIVAAGCRSDSDITVPDDGLPPAVPSELRITFANDGEIVLRWNRNNEPDLKYYTLYRSNDSIDYTKIYSLNTEYFLDDSLEYDLRYYYKISATDNAEKESELSAAVSAVPVNIYPPDKPQNPVINGRNIHGSLSVFLTWYPGYESDIAGYNIYRSENEVFEADSSTFSGFTPINSFTDTTADEIYIRYYYIIRAVDKGGLIGKESDIINDLILGIPEILSPPTSGTVEPFSHFVIGALTVPALYKIVVQTNEFFGEIWSTEVFSEKTSDTLMILFDPFYIEANKKYYWRLAVYSIPDEPNSVSELFNFIIKP